MTKESNSNTHPIQVIAITSGKGGAGRTSISVRQALDFANSGKQVLLFDADLELKTLCFDSKLNIIKGSFGLKDLLYSGPMSIKITLTSSGLNDRVKLTAAQILA